MSDQYVIIAGYTLNNNHVILGKFKTEEKAWNALEVECIRLKRLSENPFDIEQEFEYNCYVELTKINGDK